MIRATPCNQPFLVESRAVKRVWGSQRLGAGLETIGELWGAYEKNRIATGQLAGYTLAGAARDHGAELLGTSVVARHGLRFPILTKLLDTSDWLSVQLHPNDDQARKLEGPEFVGKTEAWHLIDVAPGAEIILGLKPGVDRARFSEAVRTGTPLDVIARQAARSGDTWFIPAGTVHALGPGLFLYEVQQSSDITYRVYDWDRPVSDDRQLHVEQAICCVDPDPGEQRIVVEPLAGIPSRIITNPYFTLDRLKLGPESEAPLDTASKTFHALTAIGGAGVVTTEAGFVEINLLETVLVPAAAGHYRIQTANHLDVMIATAAYD